METSINYTGQKFSLTAWDNKQYLVTIVKQNKKAVFFTAPKREDGSLVYSGAKEVKQMNIESFLICLKDGHFKPID
jgi:hypothetical protein